MLTILEPCTNYSLGLPKFWSMVTLALHVRTFLNIISEKEFCDDRERQMLLRCLRFFYKYFYIIHYKAIWSPLPRYKLPAHNDGLA